MHFIKVLFVLVAGAAASSEGAATGIASQVANMLRAQTTAMTEQQFLAQFKQGAQCPQGCCGTGCACCTGDTGLFCSC